MIGEDILRCLTLNYDYCLRTPGDLETFNNLVMGLYSSCKIAELKDDLVNLEDPS